MMDYEKIKAGVQLMLEGIGEDTEKRISGIYRTVR